MFVLVIGDPETGLFNYASNNPDRFAVARVLRSVADGIEPNN